MESARRQFFKDLGRTGAGVAAGVAAPTLAQLDALGNELNALGRGLNDKLSRASAEIRQQVGILQQRLDGTTLTLSHQQMQLYLLFFLLLLSYAIDAGMTASLLLAP